MLADVTYHLATCKLSIMKLEHRYYNEENLRRARVASATAVHFLRLEMPHSNLISLTNAGCFEWSIMPLENEFIEI